MGHRRTGTSGIGRIANQHAILLAARRRYPGLLVFVIRVARRAASLLHLVFDHRDDRVIGDAALARTIVVQNVTEPKPALLHELPRSRSFSGGIVPLDYAPGTLSLAEGVKGGGESEFTQKIPNPKYQIQTSLAYWDLELGIWDLVFAVTIHSRHSRSAACTAAGFVDCGVRRACTDARAVAARGASSPHMSLASRHSAIVRSLKSRPSVSRRRTRAPTTSCARRNGTPRDTR